MSTRKNFFNKTDKLKKVERTISNDFLPIFKKDTLQGYYLDYHYQQPLLTRSVKIQKSWETDDLISFQPNLRWSHVANFLHKKLNRQNNRCTEFSGIHTEETWFNFWNQKLEMLGDTTFWTVFSSMFPQNFQ